MSNGKRILIVSQYYYPEKFRINELSRELLNKGYEVTVLTGIPNYPEGNFYKGYKFKEKLEVIEGVNVIRIPIIPRKTGNFMLLLNYISFMISGYFWSTFTKNEYDQVFIYQLSPIVQAIPGKKYAKRKKVKVSMYILDIWPESFFAITKNNNKILKKILNKLSSSIYKNLDRIFISSPGFGESVIKRGYPKERIVYLPQFCEDEYLKNSKEGSNPFLTNKVNITFAGNIGKAQGLEVLIPIANELKSRKSNIVFNLIGDGSYKEDFKKKVTKENLNDYFVFFDSIPINTLVAYMKYTDFGYVSLIDDDFINLTIPGKIQSLMAMGIPIIVSGGEILKKLIEDSSSGFWSHSGDYENLLNNFLIAEKISSEEREQKATNSKEYYLNNFEKNIFIEKLITYMEEK